MEKSFIIRAIVTKEIPFTITKNAFRHSKNLTGKEIGGNLINYKSKIDRKSDKRGTYFVEMLII